MSLVGTMLGICIRPSISIRLFVNVAPPAIAFSTTRLDGRGEECSYVLRETGSCKSLLCPRLRFHRLRFAVARRACRLQRIEKSARSLRHVVNRPMECRLVDPRRVRESAQLSDELQRGGADFLVRRGRLEIKKRANISTHRSLLIARAARALRHREQCGHIR